MRHLNPCTAERGFTLLELMVGLTIVALLAVGAAPYMNEYSANSQLREAGNTLYSEALAAQSEAIKRNTTVRLATTATTVSVIDRTSPTAPVVLRQRTFSGNVASAVQNVDFGSTGLPSPFGTATSINLALNGQTCSSSVRCPGLRVDGGGAITLCKDISTGC